MENLFFKNEFRSIILKFAKKFVFLTSVLLVVLFSLHFIYGEVNILEIDFFIYVLKAYNFDHQT